jgi:hypothetical protein
MVITIYLLDVFRRKELIARVGYFETKYIGYTLEIFYYLAFLFLLSWLKELSAGN